VRIRKTNPVDFLSYLEFRPKKKYMNIKKGLLRGGNQQKMGG
jgi:hypothetical protein